MKGGANMCGGHQHCCCQGHGHKGGSCSCRKHGQFGPNFWTKAEKLEWLEEQLDSLREEVKAYEDRIEALKNE
jgi:hypothetical protein